MYNTTWTAKRKNLINCFVQCAKQFCLMLPSRIHEHSGGDFLFRLLFRSGTIENQANMPYFRLIIVETTWKTVDTSNPLQSLCNNNNYYCFPSLQCALSKWSPEKVPKYKKANINVNFDEVSVIYYLLTLVQMTYYGC